MNLKFLHKALIAGSCLLFGAVKTEAQITVNDNQTAQALVDMLVGPGVSTSNAVLNCAGNASGKFSGPSNLGIDSGIVLGTGIANTAGANIGLNGAAAQGVSLGGNPYAASDPDILALAGLYGTSLFPSIHNTCALEFDFIPKGDTVKFDYVFASEEYNTYACTQWTDMFVLMISGPSITPNPPFTNKRNVALVPGTVSTPVMINTINAGNSVNSACTDIDPNAPYTQYFVNNINSGGTTVAYNGFTTVLTAEAVVVPCETYHLKFAIGNFSDDAFQSAVMLKAGSLTSTNIQTVHTSGDGANSDLLHVVRGCKPAELKYQRTDCDTMLPFTFHFEIGGTAVPGADYIPIPNTLPVPGGSSIGEVNVVGLLAPPTGPRYVTIGVKHPDSVLVGASIIPIIQRDTVWIYDSLYVDISTPPTTVCPNTPITIEAHTSPALSYSWNPVTYTGLTINPNMITTRAYTITVTQPGAPSTCPPNSRTYVAVVEQYPNIITSTDTTFCIQDSVAIPVMVAPDSVDYVYKWTPATYLRADNIGTNYFSAPPGTYNYNLSVSTPVANCTRDHNIQVTAVLPERFAMVRPISGTTYEYNDIISFTASGNFIYYTWFPTELFVDPYLRDNQARALEQTDFYVVGTDRYGCKDTANILINVEYPHAPIMPNAFSPNGDGRNDVFLIPGNEFNRLIKFEVYNRWGQRVFQTTDKNRGWDGFDESKQPCAQGVYMYTISVELPNKEVRTYNGDVTLIR